MKKILVFAVAAVAACAAFTKPKPLSKAEIEKRDKANQEQIKADQDEKNKLLKEAVDACEEEGVEPTRENVAEYIGEFKGKAVTEGQVKAWTTPSKSKWSNYHCDTVKTKRGKTKYLIVKNVSNDDSDE